MQKVNLWSKYHNKCHLKKKAKSNHVHHACNQQLHSLPHKKCGTQPWKGPLFFQGKKLKTSMYPVH